jgi:hypothetical protein
LTTESALLNSAEFLWTSCVRNSCRKYHSNIFSHEKSEQSDAKTKTLYRELTWKMKWQNNKSLTWSKRLALLWMTFKFLLPLNWFLFYSKSAVYPKQTNSVANSSFSKNFDVSKILPSTAHIAVAKCNIEGTVSDKKSENIFFYFGHESSNLYANANRRKFTVYIATLLNII